MGAILRPLRGSPAPRITAKSGNGNTRCVAPRASRHNILLAQAKANNTNASILKGIDDLRNNQPWTSENSFVSFTFDNATRTHHVFTKHSKYVFMVTKALMDLGGRVYTVTTTTEGSPKSYKYKIVSKSKARTLESMSQTDSNHRQNAVAQASDLQVRPNSKTNDTVRYGGEHLLYDIKQGHLTVLTTAHEARRLASQMAAAGHDIRRKATHDT